MNALDVFAGNEMLLSRHNTEENRLDFFCEHVK